MRVKSILKWSSPATVRYTEIWEISVVKCSMSGEGSSWRDEAQTRDQTGDGESCLTGGSWSSLLPAQVFSEWVEKDSKVLTLKEHYTVLKETDGGQSLRFALEHLEELNVRTQTSEAALPREQTFSLNEKTPDAQHLCATCMEEKQWPKFQPS